MGKVVFVLVVIFLGIAWYQGWLAQWVEGAFVSSQKEIQKARPANPRADKKE